MRVPLLLACWSLALSLLGRVVESGCPFGRQSRYAFITFLSWLSRCRQLTRQLRFTHFCPEMGVFYGNQCSNFEKFPVCCSVSQSLLESAVCEDIRMTKRLFCCLLLSLPGSSHHRHLLQVRRNCPVIQVASLHRLARNGWNILPITQYRWQPVQPQRACYLDKC